MPQHVQTAPRHAQTAPQHAQTAPQRAQNEPQHAQNAPQRPQTPPQHAQSRLGGALGRSRGGSGAPKGRPRTDLGAPGRAKSGQESSKSVPGPAPRRSQTAPERCPSVFGASNTVTCACGTIFQRFWLVVRKLLCASRISFYSVLLHSDEVSNDRVHVAKGLEKRHISTSKIDPGSVKTHPGSPRHAQMAPRHAQIEPQHAHMEPPASPDRPQAPRTGPGTLDWPWHVRPHKVNELPRFQPLRKF